VIWMVPYRTLNRPFASIPNNKAFCNRASVRPARRDLNGPLQDYDKATQLRPDFAWAYYNRALLRRYKLKTAEAIPDLRKFLDLGGGTHDGFAKSAKRIIAELREKL
jgi:tetratricopeptide (TPR) repeat protein